MAAARRAGSPGAAQCKSSLTTGAVCYKNSAQVFLAFVTEKKTDGGGGAAAAHLGDDGVQPERASAMTMMRGGCEHVKGRVASNPLTMNTRENQKRASSAKRRGRRGALPAVPMGAGGRPPSVGKPVTSSFSWAGSGVLDGARSAQIVGSDCTCVVLLRTTSRAPV